MILKSDVYQYFTIRGDNIRVCKTCHIKYGASTGVSTLRSHMQRVHRSQLKNNGGSSSSSSTSSSLSLLSSMASTSSSDTHDDHVDLTHDQDDRNKRAKRTGTSFLSSGSGSGKGSSPSIMQYIDRSEYDINSHIVIAFAMNSLPLQLLESESFINMMYYWRSTSQHLPTRAKMRELYAKRASSMRVKVIDQLKQSSCSPVTIALDGWTNIRHDKVINIIPICSGVAYYWKSIVMDTERSTADCQYPHVKEAIQSIISAGVLVVGLVTDNEAVNGALHRKLVEDYPFLVHVPCAAHTIQLAVKKIVGLNVVVDSIRGMTAILSAFEKSKDYRIQLANYQRVRSPTATALCMVKPCDTRWSSTLKAAERLIELKRDIDMVIQQESSFWSALSVLVSFLAPFQIATDIVQSDVATLHDVYHQFAVLATHVDTIDALHPYYSVKSEILDAVTSNWKKNVKISAVIICAILSFDTSHKSMFADTDIQEATQWFRSFGVKFVKYYGLSQYDNEEDIKTVLYAQWSSFNLCKGVFNAIIDDKNTIRMGQLKQNAMISEDRTKQYSRWDARDVWCMYLNTACELASSAIAVLSLTASEAAVERSFSMQDSIHSKRRNRLLNSSVEDEMFIKFNCRALNKKLDTTGTVMELQEDYECDYKTAAFLPQNNIDVTPEGSTNSLDSLIQQIVDGER
jgi:hypothetical protein